MKKTSKVTKQQEELIWEIKRATKRSWLQLRRGCHELKGNEVDHTTFMVGASSRSVARKVSNETGLTYARIISWLDANSLGTE